MPRLGLGVFRSQAGGPLESAVRVALDLGYRLFDTASIYGNEKGLGDALRQGKVPREELFIVSKLWNTDQGYESTLKAFENSLNKLRLDYLDLYLIHWPVKGLFYESWRALEKLYSEGLIRSIGVSNFHIHHIEDLKKQSKIVPALNQIEFHPGLNQPELLEYCNSNGIVVQAWSPLMKGKLQENLLLRDLAGKYHVSCYQLVLKWILQKGVSAIPKSIHPERIRENAALFHFHISDEDIRRIDNLNENKRIGPDPDNFSF